MSEQKQINILIVYDQLMLADGLAAILSKYKNHKISYTTKFKNNLLETIHEHIADILILEMAHISNERIENIRHIHKSAPNLKLLILSEMVNRSFLQSLLPFIHGYLTINCSAEKLILAIHEIMETGKFLCSEAIDELFDDDNLNKNKIELTIREKEILALWLTTQKNSDIANKLNISQTTVRSHIKNIREKFGDANRVHLMRYACKENLLRKDFEPLAQTVDHIAK